MIDKFSKEQEEITTRQFYNELVGDYRSFVFYWENQSKEKREHSLWPDKMSAAEWYEQFLAYKEMYDEKLPLDKLDKV